MKYNFKKNTPFCLPVGKADGTPSFPINRDCQGLAVADYSFALGRLEAAVPSTFAQGVNC